MPRTPVVSLEDLVIATYCALDDALAQAGIEARDGKLVPRTGPAPDVDDREILCLAVLQEVFGFESDNAYQLWLRSNPTMRGLFPRCVSRQNFADRRVLLAPLMERLNGAFCELAGEGQPPFSSSTPILSMSAVPCGRGKRNAWADSPEKATAPR